MMNDACHRDQSIEGIVNRWTEGQAIWCDLNWSGFLLPKGLVIFSPTEIQAQWNLHQSANDSLASAEGRRRQKVAP